MESTWEENSLNDVFLENTERLEEQIRLLCKKAKAHSISLIYIPNTINHWKPWQVVVHYVDNKQKFFKFSKTAQETVDSAIDKVQLINLKQ